MELVSSNILFILFISNMHSRPKKQEAINSKQCEPLKFSTIKPHKKTNKTINKQQPPSNDLFGSYKIASKRTAQNSIADHDNAKYSNKIIPTDESNNCAQSKIQQSIFCYDQRVPNQEYFDKLEIRKRPPREKLVGSSRKVSKIKELSTRLKQMQNLICFQNEEVKSMKASVSEKELHRLMKIQSIQRLKLVKSIDRPEIKSQRKLQK